MPPRRGRPPKLDQGVSPSADLSQTSQAFTYLYKTDNSTVACILCEEAVKSIQEHLAAKHPTVRFDEYQQRYPTAKVVGEELETERQMIAVSADEIAEHPCGRDGVLIEKTLDEAERPHYRADCIALIEMGYDPGYDVAGQAHLMTMGRRARISLEATREQSKGQLHASQTLDLMNDIDDRINKGRQALEKLRLSRTKESLEDPALALEAQGRAAEEWVRGHIGELQVRCPGCTMMLTAPALPHWAFEASKDDHGNVYWPVWSRELWMLVVDRTIALWVMAYTLRTSPEGLRLTARRRREEWPSWIEIEWEEQQLRARLLRDDRAYIPPNLVSNARKGETNGRTE
jgi:hypothetical protein